MRIKSTNTRYSAWRNVLMNIVTGGALVVIISSVSLLGGCEYTCAAGTASSNDFQLFDAPERCVACDDGYYLDNITCVANSYTCANGTAAADGTAGGSDGDAICAICDDGYVLENAACRRARYTCTGGTEASGGPDSGNSDDELCAACYDGYYQVIEICMANEYMCEFGTQAAGGTPTGDLNINNGDTFCTGCNPGYHLDSPLCNINTYTCFNGMSVPKGTPGIDGTERCARCSPGFALVSADNTCAADSDGDNTPDSEDVDDDNDGLIEIHNLDMLHNIRHNLAGTSYDDGTGNGGDTTGALTASHLDNNCATATDGFYLCGYELTRDLDFEVEADYASGSMYYRDEEQQWRANNSDPDMADNTGWPGIGPASGNSGGFTALFDGNDFTIRNLYSRRDDLLIGFFNILDRNGHIRALHLRDAALYGRSSQTTIVTIGALVGYNLRGTVSACSAHGVVSAASGRDNTGGLVGVMEGTNIASITEGAVIASHAEVTVQGGAGADNIGGLVGLTQSYGIIIASFASGTVDGQDNNDDVGGLVGEINFIGNTVIASYASGTANGGSGADNVGALVGRTGGASSENIIASYATGTVNGGGDNDDVGGLVGSTGSGTTITASYATGAVSGDGGTDNGGGLVGNNSATITNSYGFGTVTTDVTEETTFEEMRPDDFEATDAVDLQIADADEATDYVGATWNAAGSNTLNAWNFTELDTPALMYADYDGADAFYSCDIFPATIPGTMTTIDCDATPTTLLPGQRME